MINLSMHRTDAARESFQTAYAMADGTIRFADGFPDLGDAGTLLIFGSKPLVEQAIARRGRLAYDNTTLILPGIPEAAVMGWDPAPRIESFRRIVLKTYLHLTSKPQIPLS